MVPGSGRKGEWIRRILRLLRSLLVAATSSAHPPTWTPVDGTSPPPMSVMPPTAVMPDTALVTDMSGECSAGLTAHTHW